MHPVRLRNIEKLRGEYISLDLQNVASLNDAEYLVPALEHDVIKSRRTILGTRHPVAVLHLVQNLSVGHSCSFTNFTALHASRGGILTIRQENV